MSASDGGSVGDPDKLVLTLERAKSGRATCRGCKEKIAKDETRWLACHPESHTLNFKTYFHLNCLHLSKKSLAHLTEDDLKFDGIFDEKAANEAKEAFRAVAEAVEARRLKKERKKEKKEKKKAKKKEKKKKKRSISIDSEEESLKKKRKRLKKSGVEVTINERPVKGKEAELVSKYSVMTIAELKRHLRANAQIMTGKKAGLVARCVDGELRGALPKCSQCVQGRLMWNPESGSISCRGYFDDEIKMMMSCSFVAEEVERLPWKDPEDEDAATQTPVKKESAATKVGKEEIKEVKKIFGDDMDGKTAANKMVEFARKKGLGLPTDDSEARQQVGGLFMEHKDENDKIDYVATYTDLFNKYAAKRKTEAKPKPVAKVEANSELANSFEEMAVYFAKAGGTGVFKARAMKKAAINMRALDFAISSGKEVSAGKKKVPGIGKGSGKLIDEYLETGKISELEEMRSNAAAAGD